MIEAEPAVVARTVEPRFALTWRAEFACLAAAGPLARTPGAFDAAMESIMLHRFHMGRDLLQVKS